MRVISDLTGVVITAEHDTEEWHDDGYRFRERLPDPPCYVINSDQGSFFVIKPLDLWAYMCEGRGGRVVVDMLPTVAHHKLGDSWVCLK